LKEKGIPCKNYYAGAVSWFAGGFVGHMLSGRGPRLAKIDEFFDDARNGTLPAFSVIDPDFAFNDDHPSHSVLLGQAFLSSVYAALAASPQWNRTLLLITYDEHGGFYDHVPPPACVDAHPDFRHLGFRVPALAVGPSVRRGQVVSTLFEHASVGSTLCARFGLSPLSDRMAAANTLASVFQQRPDISRIRIPKPPRVVIPPVNRWVRQTLPSSQPELETMLDRKLLPLHALDVREMETRRRSWLRYAEELGAVQTQ
jgi:phospholipase C